MITRQELIEEFVSPSSDLIVKRQKLDIIEEQLREAAIYRDTEKIYATNNAWKDYIFEKLKIAGYTIIDIEEGEFCTSFKINWNYNEQIDQIRDDEARMKLRSIPKLSINIAKFCAESERFMLDEFCLDMLKTPTSKKASHKGERDDAIHAARAGKKMFDEWMAKRSKRAKTPPPKSNI